MAQRWAWQTLSTWVRSTWLFPSPTIFNLPSLCRLMTRGRRCGSPSPKRGEGGGPGSELSGIMGLENGLFRHGLGQGIKRYPVFDAGQGFRARVWVFRKSHACACVDQASDAVGQTALKQVEGRLIIGRMVTGISSRNPFGRDAENQVRPGKNLLRKSTDGKITGMIVTPLDSSCRAEARIGRLPGCRGLGPKDSSARQFPMNPVPPVITIFMMPRAAVFTDATCASIF